MEYRGVLIEIHLHRDTQHGVYAVVITYTGSYNLEYKGWS